MNRLIRKTSRPALFVALALLLPAAAAQAGISGASTTNSSTADDSTSGVFSGAGRASTLTTLTDDGSILQTDYKFSTGAWNDSYGTSDASLTSAYTIEFTVVAPGDYTLQIDQSLDATIETQGVSEYGTAEIYLGGFSGAQTGGTLDSGTLNPSLVNYLEKTGYLEGSPVDIAIAETQSAVISGTSNGTPVQHTVTFSWDSSCDSTAYSFAYQGGDYCGVRGGISSNYGNYVTDYSTDSGTAADDGHLVTIIVTELAGPDLCAGVVCNNGDQCNNAGTCDPGTGSCSAASPVADATSCNDGDGSTSDDQCTAGVCAGVNLCAGVVCNNGDQCNDDGTCDPGTGSCSAASPVADATSCNDGDGSTSDDQCTAGVCAGVNLCAGVVCNNGDQCNDDGTCDPGTGSCSAATPVADATSCNDGDGSTGNDQCTSGSCAGQNLCAGVTCTGGDQCNDAGSCDTQTGSCSAATPVADATSCDDGDGSTGNDQCTSGSCAGQNLCAGVTCTGGDQCNDAGSCDTQTGSCSAATPVADTTSCDDGDGSTSNDQCNSGTCAGVNLCAGVVCSNGDQCNDDGTCDPSDGTCTAASPVADASSCDDGDGSTSNDQCNSGTCAGQPEISQDKDQQKCIASQAAYLIRIAKTQAKENALCVKNQGKGKLEVPVAACVVADAKSKISKLQTKFEDHQTDPDKGKCPTPTDFAYAPAAEVVAAVKRLQIDFFERVLGPDPEAVIVDATDKSNKYAALCQATILKVSDKLVQNRLKQFGVCLKKGLKAKDAAGIIGSAATAVEACWSASGPSGADKILKAVEKHAGLNVKKCDEKGEAFGDFLAGECSGESSEMDLALCIDEISACTACLMINDAFDFGLDCDALDNSVIDGSCGGVGSAGGSFVDGPVLY